MPRARANLLVVLPLALSLLCVASALQAAPGAVNLRLRGDPDRAPADGKSSIVILVEAVDALGRPAADGTMVYFVTTLGQIASPVQTIGGIAQTVLTASNVAGTAIVSAVVGAARQTIQVEFTAEPGSAARGSRMVQLDADEVAYSAEKRVFVATWHASLKYQALEIRADGIQYDMSVNVVRAQGNVTLSSGGHTLAADALRYDLFLTRGRLVRLSDNPERLLVEGDKLETRPDTSEDSALWEPLKTDDTRTWVKAKRAIIKPGEKIILDHATFYVDDTKVMSLRRHVLDPDYGGAVFGRALGFSSASGVSVDLPMYYRASASHIGSLHVSRNRAMDGGLGSPGWALGLREEYIREGRSEGAVELDDLLNFSRGMRWEHRQQFGGGMNLNVDASSARFDSSSPRLRSTNASLFRPVSGGRISLAFSQSDYGVSEQRLADLEYRLNSRRAGSDVLVTPALHLRSTRTRTQYEALAFDPDTGEPLQISTDQNGGGTSPAVDINFSMPSRSLGRGLQFNTGLTTGYAWNLAGGSAGLLDGRLTIDRRFGPDSFATFGFSYSSGNSLLQTSVFKTSRQLLTLAGQTTVKGTMVRLSASQDLAGQRRFGSAFLSRPLPFGTDILGRPLWQLETSHIFSRFDAYGASNTKFALIRALGRYQASLCYSPQGVGYFDNRPWLSPLGYGYTYSGGRHLWLEFAAR